MKVYLALDSGDAWRVLLRAEVLVGGQTFDLYGNGGAGSTGMYLRNMSLSRLSENILTVQRRKTALYQEAALYQKAALYRKAVQGRNGVRYREALWQRQSGHIRCTATARRLPLSLWLRVFPGCSSLVRCMWTRHLKAFVFIRRRRCLLGFASAVICWSWILKMISWSHRRSPACWPHTGTKKHYYRLKNGDMVRLDGGGLSLLKELAEGLEFDTGALAQGTVNRAAVPCRLCRCGDSKY